MTLDIILSNRFKKDLKLARKRGYNLDLLDEARQHLKSKVSVSHDAVKEDRLDVIVRAHDAEQETDVLILIRDVREILHAHDSDLIVKIIDKSGILIDEHDASSGCLDSIVGEFDHSLGLAASLMSDQEFHHGDVPP